MSGGSGRFRWWVLCCGVVLGVVGGASGDRLRSRHLARDELGRALVQHTQADLLPLGHHRRHEGSTPLKEMRVDAMHHQFFFIEV